ncbi:RagB/SusD family nutrient uptake outer membrane protein [Portibacter marinus]|uniref:RagB/SusD family nutrient uptake outer membrane protein n=1 Tax=Portibacter marinus TaxID=2898660 RepID=UPI001F272082|nr:RagB/SusD family nutrient uptake outer membrane protein [Portibacter marinus]
MALLVMGSCSEGFLDLAPQQSVANEEALELIDDFASSLNAVYSGLSDADYYGRYFVLVPDVMSDDVKQHPSANRAKDYAEYSAVVGDGIAEEMWQEMWEEVNNLNSVINADPDLPEVVQDEYNHMIGEAHALRGLVYFDLVRAFAQHYTYTSDASHPGVPIVLEFDQLSEPSRNTVNEVYDQIISDLKIGAERMDAESRTGTTSTLNSMAAKALLSRVYLYKEDWANAEAMATEVINSGRYSLTPTENYAASWTMDFSSESIFEISMTEADNRGSDALGRMYIVEGYGDYLPSNDLVSLIPEDDVRFSWFATDEFLDGIYAPYRLVKYPSITGEDNTIVIRLSEVYLNRAEARAQQGKTEGAQEDVNTVRIRALPTADPITSSGDELIEDILLERRKELAFEGHRLWDLMRYKKSVIRDQCTSSVCVIEYPNDKFILPIPEAELNANPNMEPNPGY